ncbi:MAG: M23 family peptidase, partial [Phormidesmis sp.]
MSFLTPFTRLNTLLNTLYHQLLRRVRLTPWLILSVVVAAVVWSSAAPSQAAYQVQISPSDPVLGDTLSVVVQGVSSAEAAPTVTVDGTDYPTFPLSANRYRALVPTSPNTSPGRMTLQVNGADGTSNVAVSIGDRSFPTQYITLSPGRAGLEGTDYEFDRLDALRALRTPTRYWNGPMTKPSSGYVSSTYGNRRYY